MRFGKTAATTLLLAGLATIPFATAPAQAKAQGAAPYCLYTTLNDKGAVDHLSVWNGCKTRQSYKVRLAHASDLACRQLEPGGNDFYSWGWPGRFDGLVSC